MIGMCVVSVVFLMSMHGRTLLGVGISYMSQGTGMVLSVPTVEIERGERAVFNNTNTGGVTLLQINGSLRRDGELQYYTSKGGVITELLPARALVGRVVAKVPLLGLLVQALGHPIGFMVFVGSPLVMIFVDILQRLMLGIHPSMRVKMGTGLRATVRKAYSV